MVSKEERVKRILRRMQEIAELRRLHRITPRSWETRDITLRTRLLKESKGKIEVVKGG